MSSYQVLARRFRPVDFEDVVGQEEVLASLRSSLAQERLPHALLFTGSRGVGKTTTARILARAVNCEVSPGPEPCGKCQACTSILSGSASDVIELDAASNNGVEEVRALREQAGYAPIRLRRKVFILDEVHMFSRAAFNALLKVLEEPPEHVLFVLATTEAHKIPETVRSRCQVLPFRRIQTQDIAGRLAALCAREGVEAASEVLEEIAASSMGGLRDAETSLERILPLADSLDLDAYRRLVGRLGPSRAAELVLACMSGELAVALRYAAEAVETGVDERECLGEVLEVLRLVLLLLVDGEDTVLVEAAGAWRERLLELARKSDIETLDAMLQLVILARDRIRVMDDRRVLLELTLVRLARVGNASSLGELLAAAQPRVRQAAPQGQAAPQAQLAPQSQTAASVSSSATPSTEASKTPRDASTPKLARNRSSSQDADPWVRTVESALEERARLGTLLSQATLQWQGDAMLQLGFGKLKTIERTLIKSAKSRQWIEEALSGFAGRAVQVKVLIEASGDRAAPAAKLAAGRAPGRGTALGKEGEAGEAAAGTDHDSAATPRPKLRGVDPSELPAVGRRAAELFDVQHVEREDGTS